MELRVFLVEDMLRMHGLLRDLFNSIGGVVVATVSTEAEAKLWLEDHKGQWDLAVIDLVLDQGAGLEVIRRCKEDPLAGKVAVFSSYASPGVRAHCLALGADAVFDKNEPQEFIAWCADLTARENSGP
ncbi:response regulator [Caenimonas sedimenti]|uniref:Response regulator n=1 Tax=Caenimonas sedimenti TaxID=2596921 RepID=A0A562ZXR7_9BURK|nr:response regulator [Caenimonas sedimenti]TWO73157.1 response regulator [Caenimonas sedimenti]